jgi:K+ transporter
MAIDLNRLRTCCEDVLLNYVGPAGFILAEDATAKHKFFPNLPDEPQMRAFAITLRSLIPVDLPRDVIIKQVHDAYFAKP